MGWQRHLLLANKHNQALNAPRLAEGLRERLLASDLDPLCVWAEATRTSFWHGVGPGPLIPTIFHSHPQSSCNCSIFEAAV